MEPLKMRVRFVLESNGVRHGSKRTWILIDGEKKVNDALLMLNKRQHFLTTKWGVDQVKMSCCVDDAACEDLAAVTCEISTEDLLCEVIQDDICIVVLPTKRIVVKLEENAQPIVKQEENDFSNISNQEEDDGSEDGSMVVPEEDEEVGLAAARGATRVEVASGGRDDAISLLDSDSENNSSTSSYRPPVGLDKSGEKFKRRRARQAAIVTPPRIKPKNKRQKTNVASVVSHETRATDSCSNMKRSFLKNSEHYIFHSDTGIEWPCTVDTVLEDGGLFDIDISVPGDICPGLITVARDQLLEKTRARREVFDKVWAAARLSSRAETVTDSVAESADSFEARPRATVRLDGALPTNVSNMLDPPCEDYAGWIQYEPHNERTMYYALDNETTRQIAKKMNAEPKRLLSDNKQLLKELTLNGKVKALTEFALPLKCKWSPVADGIMLGRQLEVAL